MNNKAILIIMDGWGIGSNDTHNAIFCANTPFVDSLYSSVPNSTLNTSGLAVGLPEGQMGNSEVGHLNIGAGRVVYQELARIHKSVADGDFFTNPTLLKAIQQSKAKGTKLHLLGLVSDGGVHSHIDHLKALMTMCAQQGHSQAYIHAFTDGRDCDPQSGLGFIQQIEEHSAQTNVVIASVIGRYFAMDRDKRWERVKKAYNLLTNGVGSAFLSASEAIKASYNAGITDEFIEPAKITNNSGEPIATIEHSDTVIFFNFRTDRGRELTQALHQQAFPEFNMEPLELDYFTLTRYDETFRNIEVVFEKDNLQKTLGEVLAENGKTQLRMAETEKYPHVTFFFNGQREEPFPGEDRIMAISPKVATYDLQPEMSAPELTEKALAEINKATYDFICINFANTDMVGHTGVFEAIIKAAETVDVCVKQLVEAGTNNGYSLLITADHGNADLAINEDGSPNTAHTTNPVPVFLVNGPENTTINAGKLADLAPTILQLMNLSAPSEMDGTSLLKHRN